MFKAKLSKQGNSYCIYIPKDVRTKLDLNKEYEWSVRTDVITEDTPQISFNKIESTETTNRPWEWCKKHTTSKSKCGCK